MTYMYRDDRESAEEGSNGFDRLLDELNSGDCMVVERFSGAAKNAKSFVALLSDLYDRGIRFRSVEEKFDTGTDEGRYALGILRRVAQLDGEYRREKQRDGINNAKEEGKYKGRKPIEVDEESFDSILERWRNGEITARQAMNELNLKPNTFYRRVKERMTDTKAGESIWDAAKQLGKEIVAGVQAETVEFTQAAEKLAADYDVDAVKEQLEKNINAAGKIINRHVENLSRDFQEAMEQYDQPRKDPAEESPEEVSEEDTEGKEWI